MDYLKKISVVIMAAGKGKRMKSETSKVLHNILGQLILYYILSTVSKINPKNMFIVTGYKSKLVEEYLKENFPSAKTAYQEKPLGTAHAIFILKDYLYELAENLLILPGDCPLITLVTLKKLVEEHIKGDHDATLLTTILLQPYGYGRIVRDERGSIKKVVEESDATEEEKKINEVNTSIYCFNTKKLFKNIKNIDSNNTQNEYYLTDIMEKFVEKRYRVSCLKTLNNQEILGINDRIQLSEVEKVMQKKINENLMLSGVTIRNPETSYIEESAEIEKDTIIEPFCFIKGKSKIKSGCTIGPFSQITDTQIGENTKVNSSMIIGSIIGKNNNIGPYSYIRPGTITGENVKIGAFCEVKKSKIAQRSKVPPNSLAIERGKQVNIEGGATRYRKNKEKKQKKE